MPTKQVSQPAEQEKSTSYQRSGETRAAKTRAKIFIAFIRLLRSPKGQNITVGLICERARVSQASFYKNFKNADELLRLFFDQAFESTTRWYRLKKDDQNWPPGLEEAPFQLTLLVGRMIDTVTIYPGIFAVEGASWNAYRTLGMPFARWLHGVQTTPEDSQERRDYVWEKMSYPRGVYHAGGLMMMMIFDQQEDGGWDTKELIRSVLVEIIPLVTTDESQLEKCLELIV